MANIAKENLDERIERIKKRNEEIEKKYREAEEDRLMALKDNAMVETKPPKDEDWPKGHKYDKIDFTYDVKPEKLEELKQRKQEEVKAKRDYKKFPDGEGPPPDPAYNFLADAERDGVVNPKIESKGDKKDFRQNNKNKDNNKRSGPNNNSFRGRGGKTHNAKYQKQNSQPEYEQWRSEREKIDEARINRQKVGDGKWRREWDNDKINAENEALLRPERSTLGDAVNAAAAKRSPTHGKHNHYSGQNSNNTDCLIEKRGNITVSVSQTGEVKSVKLTSAPVIGTGRVGPRQISKPQFSVQAIEGVSLQQVPISPKLQKKDSQHKPGNISQNNHQHKGSTHSNNQSNQLKSQNSSGHNNQNNPKTHHKMPPTQNGNQQASAAPAAGICPSSPMKNKRKQQNPKFVPPQNMTAPESSPIATPLIEDAPAAGANGVLQVDLSHKPEFARRSVQERLLRVRQVSQNDAEKKSNAYEVEEKQSPVFSPGKDDERTEDLETNCDKSNESIQAAEPIVACN